MCVVFEVGVVWSVRTVSIGGGIGVVVVSPEVLWAVGVGNVVTEAVVVVALQRWWCHEIDSAISTSISIHSSSAWMLKSSNSVCWF